MTTIKMHRIILTAALVVFCAFIEAYAAIWDPAEWQKEPNFWEQKEKLELMIASGNEDGIGWAITHATRTGNIGVVRLLLEQASITKDLMEDMLYEATNNSKKDIAEMLLKHGADVNGHRQVLSAAAYDNNVEFVRYYLDKGADVNEKDWEGVSLLYNSFSRCIPADDASIDKLRILKMLINAGAKFTESEKKYGEYESFYPDIQEAMSKVQP